MSQGAATKPIAAVSAALQGELGDELISLCLYGSLTTGTYQHGQSDINLLAIVADDITFYRFREALRPVWREYGSLLKKNPIIATQANLENHLDLNPVLAQHLSTHAQPIIGDLSFPEPAIINPLDRLSRFSYLAMHASAAVAPSLLPEMEACEVKANLQSLSRQYFNEFVDETTDPEVLVARLQQDLLEEIARYPEIAWDNQNVPGAPPLLSDLRAIYEFENRLILVLPDMEPENVAARMASIDWLAVANRVANQYRGLRLTSPAELRLVIRYNTAADHVLGSYDHAWGLDPLADLIVEEWRVFRDLARLPSDLLLSGLPHAYVTTEDSDLAMLVHDFQNKLLNIQLRNELFCRIDGRPVVSPPNSLPDRDEPINQRVEAIFAHLDWWATYYTSAIKSARTNKSQRT
jgi:hypothetical protein